MPLSLAVFGLLLAAVASWPSMEPGKAVGLEEPYCLTDPHGQTRCAKPGGDVILDFRSHATCGPGQCVLTASGKVFCSSIPGESAEYRIEGRAVCTGGCVEGSVDYCLQDEE